MLCQKARKNDNFLESKCMGEIVEMNERRDKISVIIPVYNVEKYLKACIQSVLNQTYKQIEVILVDDGSTDRSGTICDSYAAMDKRVVVHHKENGGLSSARNMGIKLSSGKYISFIDSDDYVAPDYVELLFKSITDTNTKISLCDYKKVDECLELIGLDYKIDTQNQAIILNNKDSILNVYYPIYHGVDFVSVAKLYDRALFEDNNIDFPEGKVHEDAFTTYKLFYASDSISYLDKEMYFYRMREGSITTSKFSMKRFDKIEATREECNFFYERGEKKLLEVAFFDHIHLVKMLLKEFSKSDLYNKNIFERQVQLLKEDIGRFGCIIDWPIKKKVIYKLLTTVPSLIKLV